MVHALNSGTRYFLTDLFTKKAQNKGDNAKCYDNICREIANDIMNKNNSADQTSIKEINKLIKFKSSKYRLSSIPKYRDIIKFLPNDNYYKKILRIKPVKTLSGIAVITVMPMPYNCPHGKCIYCPGGIEVNTPLSYIGTEPSTKVAQQVNFDPFKQVTSKINQLIENGHEVNKAELVIVGGTFPYYPLDYQINFVRKCYDALNSYSPIKQKQFVENNSSSISGTSNVNYSSENCEMEDKHTNDKIVLEIYEPGTNLDLLRNSKRTNETALVRCVGLTIETKPDYCKEEHIDIMLNLGTTRIELGVQSLNDRVFKLINRGHTLQDIYRAFYVARNSGYKIGAHMMPGLPGSTYLQDIADSKKLFDDEGLKPDMVKIYPTLVIKNTGLYKLYKEGKYQSYSIEDLVNLLVEVKKIIPPWVRIMRIQREVESTDVVSGPKMGNIRQLVLDEMKRQGIKCKCIRCREIGLLKFEGSFDNEEIILLRREYFASGGKEIFLSYELKDQSVLFGFLRLRLMHYPIRKELQYYPSKRDSSINLKSPIYHSGSYNSAIVRELHVYGPVAKIQQHFNQGVTYSSSPSDLQIKENKIFQDISESGNIRTDFSNHKAEYQHKGLGRSLLNHAEKICKTEYNLKYLSVISAIGTRNYYRKFGYTNNGPYVTKIL